MCTFRYTYSFLFIIGLIYVIPNFRELADATTICLTFKAPEVESGYASRADPFPMAAAAPPVLLLPTVAALTTFAVPPSWSLHAVYLAFILETGLFNVIYYSYFRFAQYKVFE